MAVKASYQITMADITDAYAVNLSSEAYTFTGNTSGAPSGLSCSTIVTAYCGSNACSKVSVSVSCPTGISATVTNNNTASPTITFKTTATVTSSCQATITVAVDDVTITKKFSFAVAKTGATGPAGEDGVNATQNMWIDRYFIKTDSYTWGNPAYVTYPTDVTPPVGKCMLISGRDHYCNTEKFNQSVSNQRKYRIECTAMAKDSSVALAAGIWSYGHTTGNSYSTYGTMTRGRKVSGNWYRYYYEFTPKNDPQTAAIFFQLNQVAGTGTAAWYISDVTWVDITEADNASKVATNFLKYDSNGLCIGDQTGSAIGRNILIDSDSIEFRNGNTVLASYSDNYVYLGKNNMNTKIDLCNGTGFISSSENNALNIQSSNPVLLFSGQNPSSGIQYTRYSDFQLSQGTGSSYEPCLYIHSRDANTSTNTSHYHSIYAYQDTFRIYGGSNRSGISEVKKYDIICQTLSDSTGHMSFSSDTISMDATNIYINGTTYINGYRPILSLYEYGYWGMTDPGGYANGWLRTPQPGIIPYQSGGASSLGTSSWPFAQVCTNRIDVYGPAFINGQTNYNNYGCGEIFKTSFGYAGIVTLSNGANLSLYTRDPNTYSWKYSMVLADANGIQIAAKNHTHKINELYANSGNQRILYNSSNNLIPTSLDGSPKPNVTNLGSTSNYFKSLYYGGTLSKQSDRRVKNHISDLSEDEMITILSGSKIRKYTYKNDSLSEINYGVYAQDLRDLLIESGIGHIALIGIDKVDDEVRIKDLEEPEENVRYTVDYTQYAPVLVTGWQYNDRRIKELIERNKLLEAKIESLQYQLQQVFDKLANLEKSIGG